MQPGTAHAADKCSVWSHAWLLGASAASQGSCGRALLTAVPCAGVRHLHSVSRGAAQSGADCCWVQPGPAWLPAAAAMSLAPTHQPAHRDFVKSQHNARQIEKHHHASSCKSSSAHTDSICTGDLIYSSATIKPSENTICLDQESLGIWEFVNYEAFNTKQRDTRVCVQVACP